MILFPVDYTLQLPSAFPGSCVVKLSQIVYREEIRFYASDVNDLLQQIIKRSEEHYKLHCVLAHILVEVSRNNS